MRKHRTIAVAAGFAITALGAGLFACARFVEPRRLKIDKQLVTIGPVLLRSPIRR